MEEQRKTVAQGRKLWASMPTPISYRVREARTESARSYGIEVDDEAV